LKTLHFISHRKGVHWEIQIHTNVSDDLYVRLSINKCHSSDRSTNPQTFLFLPTKYHKIMKQMLLSKEKNQNLCYEIVYRLQQLNYFYYYFSLNSHIYNLYTHFTIILPFILPNAFCAFATFVELLLCKLTQ